MAIRRFWAAAVAAGLAAMTAVPAHAQEADPLACIRAYSAASTRLALRWGGGGVGLRC